MADKETVADDPSPPAAAEARAALEAREVEALLGGLARRGLAGCDGGVAESPWLPYDFARAARELSAGEIARLRVRATELRAAIASRLGAFLGRPLAVELVSAAVVDHAELTRNQPRPASLHLARSTEPAGRWVVAVSPRILLGMVGTLIGALDIAAAPPLRALTPLEQEIAYAVVAEMLTAQAEAWGLGQPIEIERSADAPRDLEILPPDAPVALMSFNLRLEGRASVEGDLHVAIPAGEILVALCAPPRCDPAACPDGAPEQRIRARLGARQVELRVEIESLPLRIADLIELAPGDVIDTGVDVELAERRAPAALARVRVGSVEVARGAVGTREGNLAVRLA